MNWYKIAQQGLLFYPHEGAPQGQTEQSPPIGFDPETGQNIHQCSMCQNQILEKDIEQWIIPDSGFSTPYQMPTYDPNRISQAFQEISQYLAPFHSQLQQFIQSNNLNSSDYTDLGKISRWEVQVPEMPNILNNYPEIGDICSIKRSSWGALGLCKLFEIGTEINGQTIIDALKYLSNPESINDFMKHSNEEYEMNQLSPICYECAGELTKCEFCDKKLFPGTRKYTTTYDDSSYVCEECIEGGSAEVCIGCGKADVYEDMHYMEDEGHFCADCYKEGNEKILSWAEKAISELSLPVGKTLPISPKSVQGLERFLQIYLKKHGDNVLNSQEWGKFYHVAKKGGLPNGAFEYLDSIAETYDKGNDSYSHNKVSDISKDISNISDAQKYMKEQYPGLKSYQDIPYDISIVENYGGNNDKQGFTIAIEPSDKFLEYGKRKFPNIEEVWDKMNNTPHHSGYLAYARCTYEQGDYLVINNLQRDADFDNFNSKAYRYNSDEDIEAAKWIDKSTKNWDSFLLDVIKSMSIANDITTYLTTFDQQKRKWGNLPIHKSKKTYQEVPEQMGFAVEDAYGAGDLIEDNSYSPDMYQIANDTGKNWYKTAQLNYPLEDPPMYGHSDYKSHGGRIVQMSPEDFLQQTPHLEIDESSQENINELKDMILSGRKIDPANLYYRNGKISDHDGRHRAIAAQQLGIDSIPVLILELN